jgi:hypothetical protein
MKKIKTCQFGSRKWFHKHKMIAMFWWQVLTTRPTLHKFPIKGWKKVNMFLTLRVHKVILFTIWIIVIHCGITSPLCHATWYWCVTWHKAKVLKEELCCFSWTYWREDVPSLLDRVDKGLHDAHVGWIIQR